MKEQNAKRSEKLELWQQRLNESDAAFGAEVKKMNQREAIYNGDRTLAPLVHGDTKKSGGPKETSHVRNIVFENIESQVSTAIPQPKVTPRRKKDERLAGVIEHFLRNELDRLPMEELNDMAERTVPIQGGTGWMVEWDNTKRTHSTVGEVTVSLIHPKQFAPQPGVYTGIQDMDWFIIKVPTTRSAVRRKYGIEVDDGESEPEIRGGDGGTTDGALTQYIAFERNEEDGINRYSWVNDTELEDLENYQARRQPVCRRCGRVRPLPGQIIGATERDAAGDLLPDPARGFAGGLIPQELAMRQAVGRMLSEEMAEGIMAEASSLPASGPSGAPAPAGRTETPGVMLGVEIAPGAEPEPERYDGGPCPWCGSEEWDSEEQAFEQVMLPIRTGSGVTVPGMQPGVGEDGRPAMQPTLVPYYQPRVMPIILQRSVSVYGQLLGTSDVDVIRDQQNTVNRLEQKIIDRLIKAGTRITLPNKANLRTDPEDGERWFIDKPTDKELIGIYDFKGDLQYELAYLAQVYEEARQLLGITDSFQGRHDATATSGVAKQFSAAQAAGRLESKRAMKQAAYAKLFELMFKFWLAYGDEPRDVSYKDFEGNTQYEEFRRYDFLEQDADGTYWWNDQFIFSCDTSETLASNREAMWQETRLNLQTGAFGNPQATDTLILFWAKMEELHYPGAATTREYLEKRLEQEQQAAAQQAAAQQAAAQASQAPPPEAVAAIEQQARQDAAQAALNGRI